MKKIGPTFDELKQEVEEIKDRFPDFDSDGAFIVWLPSIPGRLAEWRGPSSDDSAGGAIRR